MTYEQMTSLLAKTGIPWAFDHWERPPAPPFGCWLDDATANFGADNRTYHVINDYTLELYMPQRDQETEGKVEQVLDEADIFWDKTASYLSDLRMYEIVYDIEV